MNTIFLTDIDKAVFGAHDTLAGPSDLGVLTAKQPAPSSTAWAGLSASVGASAGLPPPVTLWNPPSRDAAHRPKLGKSSPAKAGKLDSKQNWAEPALSTIAGIS